jgi:hypothetical protein
MRHAWPRSLSRVDLEFSIAGARREGEFVEGLTFLIAQMFGIVLWAWNRIQSGLRGLVTYEGLHDWRAPRKWNSPWGNRD